MRKQILPEEFLRMQKLAGLIIENELNKDEVIIELYQGTELKGPKEKEAEVKELVKKIEKDMRSTFNAAKKMGSESRAMDERDDTVYEYEDELKKLGFKIL